MQNFIPIYQQIWILPIFSNFSRFCTEFILFSPKKSNFGPTCIQLDIIAYMVSKALNYNYAKFHAFIKKLTIDVIFCWLKRISCVVS